jgi:CubicO group peptidase (beta-lactamase class C family)
VILPTLFGCVAPDPTVDGDPRFSALQAWTGARLQEWKVPGAALVVVDHGEVHLAGVGVRTWGLPDPVTPDSLFRFGSISKMFTGALAAEAAVAGELDLDVPSSTYLGGVTLGSGRLDDVTLFQLLSHQSGLQSIGLPNQCDTDPDAAGAVLAEEAADWSMWSPPGELFNYSNNGYALVGHALEQARGERFLDQASGLLDAAGMATATYDWEAATAREHATGHIMNLETGAPADFRGFDDRACVASFPSGGLMGSARDLGALLSVLLDRGDGWVSPAAWTRMTTEGWRRTETSGYGFGLQSTSYRDHPGFTHHGSVGGYYAMVWIVPDAELGVGVLVNASHLVTDPPEPWAKPTQRIMVRALDLFLGLPPQEITWTIRPPEDWDRFVGVYESAFDLGTVVIAQEGDTLWYADDRRVVPLSTYSADTFQYGIPEDDGSIDWWTVSFDEGSQDEISWLLSAEGVARRR